MKINFSCELGENKFNFFFLFVTPGMGFDYNFYMGHLINYVKFVVLETRLRFPVVLVATHDHTREIKERNFSVQEAF